MHSSTSRNRYSDFYKSSPYAAFPQEHRTSPGKLHFSMICVDQSDHDFTDPSVPEMLLALPLTGSAHGTWSWNLGDGWMREAAAPGRMLVLPANSESSWKVRGSRKLLLLAIPTSTAKQVLGSAAPKGLELAMSALAHSTWEDDAVRLLMVRLWQGMHASHGTDRLLADGALTAILSMLVQRAGVDESTSSKQVAMPLWRLKRVFEFADENLQEKIDMVALAEAAGLSVRHFARAFSEETGETPHRWLMGRRVERALDLLKKTDMPLIQIADACGFASQSHFTKVIKQVTGTSPKRWLDQQADSHQR